MKREVFFYTKKNGTVCVMVEMDEEMFNELVNSYKGLWTKKRLGDNVSALNLVREILHAAEEGCKKNEL